MLHLTQTRTGDLADTLPRFEADLVPVADGRFVGWLESDARWTPVTFADDRFVYLGLRAAVKLSLPETGCAPADAGRGHPRLT
jgi:hypothetical protein